MHLLHHASIIFIYKYNALENAFWQLSGSEKNEAVTETERKVCKWRLRYSVASFEVETIYRFRLLQRSTYTERYDNAKYDKKNLKIVAKYDKNSPFSAAKYDKRQACSSIKHDRAEIYVFCSRRRGNSVRRYVSGSCRRDIWSMSKRLRSGP